MIEREQSPFSQSVKARQIRFLIPKPRPGGRKNIFNEYATKLINPEPPPPSPPSPTLPHEIRNLEGFLSKKSPNTILLAFLGKKRTNKAKVK